MAEKSSPAARRAEPPLRRQELRRLTRLFRKPRLTLPDYYAVGECLRRLEAEPSVSGVKGWRVKLAEQLGCSRSTLDKCLQFRHAYARKELGGLKRLGIGWAQLTIALGVGKKHERQRLLARARKEGWGQRELQRAIQRLKGSRRGGGRPRKGPKGQGLLADLSELLRRADLLAEFGEGVWAGQQQAYAKELGAMPGPAKEAVKALLAAAVERLKALRGLSGAMLEGLRALRQELSA